MPKTQKKICFVGVSDSMPTRKLEKPEVQGAIEACREAIEDAGLDPSEVDGINVQVHHYPPPETLAIAKGLGMKEVNWQRDGGGLGMGPAGVAAQALDAGLCKYVVLCKIMNTVAPVATPRIDPKDGGVASAGQFQVPYGVGYTSQSHGFNMRRYMWRYGITEEQMAWVALVAREHALMNPRAYQRTPLTMQDYLASRFIAEPVRLYDCDIPVNVTNAYVMTTEDRAKALKRRPVYLIAWAETPGGMRIPDHLQGEHLEGMSPIGEILYKDAGLGPKDMDLWFMYDGFAWFVPQWMENLGLVPRGEGGNYIDGGTRIRYNGEHPVNTHGGNLSAGRSHGTTHILEAVRQLRGEAGPRQAKKGDNVIISSVFPYTGGAGIVGKGL